jgi:hypothetical protein
MNVVQYVCSTERESSHKVRYHLPKSIIHIMVHWGSTYGVLVVITLCILGAHSILISFKKTLQSAAISPHAPSV